MESNAQISLENTVSRNSEKLLTNTLGDEIVMMDLDSGNYLNINPIGSKIWKILETPIKVKDLLQVLLNRFDVSEEQCREELFLFLHQLKSQGLITIAE